MLTNYFLNAKWNRVRCTVYPTGIMVCWEAGFCQRLCPSVRSSAKTSNILHIHLSPGIWISSGICIPACRHHPCSPYHASSFHEGDLAGLRYPVHAACITLAWLQHPGMHASHACSILTCIPSSLRHARIILAWQVCIILECIRHPGMQALSCHACIILPGIMHASSCHASCMHHPAIHHACIILPCIMHASSCHASCMHHPAMHHARIILPCIMRASSCHASCMHHPAMHHACIILPCIMHASSCHASCMHHPAACRHHGMDYHYKSIVIIL